MRKSVAVGLAIALLCLGGASLAGADTLGYYVQGSTVNLGGPAYDWWYGCSPTSAGMMMGYYDIHGYAGKSYAKLVPGGTAESKTGSSNFNTTYQKDITYKVNNIIASYGYVTDYYRNSSGTPDYTNGGTDPGYYNNSKDDAPGAPAYNCLAYYMGTSQDALGNSNGSTPFTCWTSGAKFTAQDAYNLGVWNKDGMYGMDEYFHYCGYGASDITKDTNFFTQHIYNSSTAPNGFKFADYKKEIDDGRVMMIQIANDAKHTGHSMFGYGYVDNGLGQQYILCHNTWDDGVYEMLWGGIYSEMTQWGVVGFDPTGGSPVPLPGAVWLLGSGLLGLWGAKRRWSNS
ncbi:MAG: hypothetical protein NTW80_11005 [Deltaproteobacteria bacterium]|nr:hypothetical protein [Deltaproteobacteria bacterium]